MAGTSNGRASSLVALVAVGAKSGEAGLAAALREQYTQNLLTQLLHDPEPETQKAAAFALGLIGDQTVASLLAAALKTENLWVHAVVEQSLWRLWFRSGNADTDALLRDGVRRMEEQRLDEARAVFDRVIADAPDYAEGYNQRAIVLYLMGEWEQALQDCQRVLELTPVHFGALAGMGHCYLREKEVRAALTAYERALSINPHMPGIQQSVEQLRELLRREGGTAT